MDIWKDHSQAAKKERWKAFWAMEDLPRPLWFIPATPVLSMAFGFSASRKRSLTDLFLDRETQFKRSMTFNRLFRIAQRFWSKDDFVLHLQPQLGVGVFASAFGCEVDFPPDQMPRTRPVIRSAEPAERVYEFAKPSPNAGLLGKVLDYAEYFNTRAGSQYPVAVTDVQGPMDTAILVWDTTDFMVAMIRHKKEVHHLMRLCTDLIIDHVKTMRATVREFVPAHMPMVYLPDGMGITVSEDVLALLSPPLYEEFCVPYLNELAEEFGGIVIHSCGNFEHQLGVLGRVHNLRGINFGVSETRFEAVWEAFGGKIAVVPHCTAEVGVARFANALEWIEHVLKAKNSNRGLALMVIPLTGDAQMQSHATALGSRPNVNAWELLRFGRDVRALIDRYK